MQINGCFSFGTKIGVCCLDGSGDFIFVLVFGDLVLCIDVLLIVDLILYTFYFGLDITRFINNE